MDGKCKRRQSKDEGRVVKVAGSIDNWQLAISNKQKIPIV
jgi:hypothetical protein